MNVNEFNLHRVAFGNASLTAAANPAASTSVVLTIPVTGAFLPKGAIVTGIQLFPAGAVTMSGCSDATLNVACSNQVLGTAGGTTASQVILAAKANSLGILAGSAYVSVGGQVYLHLASSDGNRSAQVFDADVYVSYLYCADRDVA